MSRRPLWISCIQLLGRIACGNRALPRCKPSSQMWRDRGRLRAVCGKMLPERATFRTERDSART